MKFLAKHPEPAREGVPVEIRQDGNTVDLVVAGVVVAHLGDPGRLFIHTIDDGEEVEKLQTLGLQIDSDQIECEF